MSVKLTSSTSSVPSCPTSMASTSSSTAASPRPLLLPELPDDVAIQCLARIPLYQHPTLSLVSKSWRSIFKSSHLHTTRRLLRCSRHSLFLTLRLNCKLLFFTLSDPSSPIRSLSPLPPIPSNPIGPAFAAIGTKIYVIGGSIDDKPSNSIWIFDCRFNTWESGPKMKVGREFAAVGVTNGKIYVLGGCLPDNWTRSLFWAESFDPIKGSWAAVPSPIENKDKWMHASVVLDGKVYAMADRGGVVYDVVERQWGEVREGLDSGWRGRAVVVGQVLYCYDYMGKIRGYDVAGDYWRELRLVDKGLPKFLCGAAMADLGGNLCVVWEGERREKETEIVCAEIEVCKEEDGALNGLIVWCDVILRVPNRASIVSCFGVGL